MRGYLGLTTQQHLMAGTAAIVAIACASPAMAQTRTFNVPAQSASRGIPEFGRQGGVQIIASGKSVKAKKTNAVHGTYSIEYGLKLLLGGTGLVASRTPDSDIISVRELPSGEVLAANAPAEQASVDERGIADILVVGSRSQNADIKRTRDDPQPYVVFDRQTIEASQAVTLDDFLRTRLTSNTQQASSAQTTGLGTTRSSINLRGLGSNQTLILVDGRRLTDMSIQGAFGASGQPDINGIPINSIERIEVLPSTAGGIYGGGAVGGVINIILRHDYRGLEIRGTYADTADFHAPTKRLDVSAGLSLEGGRTHITASGSIVKSDPLLAGDRDFGPRGFARGLKNAPEDFTGFPPPRGQGANIYGLGNLVLKPQYGGTALNTNITNVPSGFSGTLATLAPALVANDGKYNYDQPLGVYGKQRSLLSSPDTRSLNVNVRREFASWLDIFADYSKFVNIGTSYGSSGTPSQVVLSPDAPTNPFQQNIVVVFDPANTAFRYRYKSDSNRATLGFVLHLPHKWSAGFDYTWNWARFSSTYTNSVIDAVGSNCALQGIAPSNVGTGAGQCNPAFGASASDTRPILNPLLGVNYQPYLLPTPNASSGPLTSTRWTPSLRLAGPLFNLPAGPVNLTTNFQRDISRTNFGYSSTLSTLPIGQTVYSTYNPAQQTDTSEYAEVRVPLFNNANGHPLLRLLELQASVRHDDFLTLSPTPGTGPVSGTAYSLADATAPYVFLRKTNHSTNYTVAARYAPVDGVVLRASYGTGFLQPNVNQVFSQTQIANLNIFDPLRGNKVQSSNYTVTSGAGGPDLKPEDSKSLSVGIIVAPKFLPGLRLSADYTRIKKTNEIANLGISLLLSNPDLFPGRLVRDPLTPQDQALGYTGGLINTISVLPVNALNSLIQTVDFQADYTFKTRRLGQFRLYALATWEPDLKRQLFLGQPTYNYAGYANGPLQWRANGGIDWTIGRFSVQYNAQFYDAYNINNVEYTAATRASVVELQGSSKIPTQMYHDLYISYTTPKSTGTFSDVQISFGIQNLFNTEPPIIAIENYSQGGYSGYGDPRLRRFTLSLKKAFGN